MIDKFNTRHPKLLNLITKPLAKKTNPKILLAFSLLFSMHACHFYATNETHLAAAAVTLSSYFTLLAAQTSKKHQKTPSTHLTRTADRIRDIFIFTGITLNQQTPMILGFITLTAVVLLPHIAAHAQTLAKTKTIPKISRGDIAIILITSTIATLYITSALACALIIITALTIYSFAQTLANALKNHANHPDTSHTPQKTSCKYP